MECSLWILPLTVLFFFYVFTTYVFSLQNSRWEDGPGLLPSLTTGTRMAGPWPGKIHDRQCRPAQLQLSSCPGLLRKLLLILGRFLPLPLVIHGARSRLYCPLQKRDTASLHLAWALGQRCEDIPKAPTHCHPTLQGSTLGFAAWKGLVQVVLKKADLEN